MGYNTQFEGEFSLNKPLDEETCCALEDLADSRHDDNVAPSVWCQWVVGADRQSIKWDGGEKFYGYIGWIRYINHYYLLPKGVKLNGDVAFQGEFLKDCGRIVASEGRIKVLWMYDDPKLSNYDPKSKCWCHIPRNQEVTWINGRHSVFCDLYDSSFTDSEEEYALERTMVGITVGNRRAMAVLVDVSAEPGTNRPFDGYSDVPVYQRARLMSIDMVIPLVDFERGARARLMQLHKALLRESKKRRNGRI